MFQNPVCVLYLTAHLNLDTKLSLEILDPYLDFIKKKKNRDYKIDLHTKLFQNILKTFSYN